MGKYTHTHTLKHTAAYHLNIGKSPLPIILVWCLGWTNTASHCQFNLKHRMIWKIKRQRGLCKHTHNTGCGWWPKRVLWVKDEKEHFALGSNVFVVMPGLSTVLCHDSCPPIQSHQSSISTPPWLGFKSQHHTVLIWERQYRIEKIVVAMGCRFFWLN